MRVKDAAHLANIPTRTIRRAAQRYLDTGGKRGLPHTRNEKAHIGRAVIEFSEQDFNQWRESEYLPRPGGRGDKVYT